MERSTEQTPACAEAAPAEPEIAAMPGISAASLAGLTGRGTAGVRGAAIAQLQRTAGNAAVRRVLARQETATQPQSQGAPDPVMTALAARDFAAAAAAMAGLDEATITTRVGSLSEDEVFLLLMQAALVTPFPTELTRVLSRIIATRRSQKLEGRVITELEAGRFNDAAKLIVDLDSSRVVALLKGRPQAQLDQLAAEVRKEAPHMDELYRQIRFAAVNLPDDAPRERFNVEKSTVAHTGKTKGGDVTVHTDATLRGSQKNNSKQVEKGLFAMTYSGKDSERTHWLQFIWREAVVEHPTKGTFRVDEEIETSGGKYRLTTDPELPNYNTDRAPGAATPFYEHTGAGDRTATAITMADRPSSFAHVARRELGKGATRVTTRANFHTYLVRDTEVLYRVDLTNEWVWTNQTEPPKKMIVHNAGPANRLEPRMRERLILQYPRYDYLP